MHLQLAHTQGFCAGVSHAITIVDEALRKYGAPIYVRHHIVHNTAIIRGFEQRGVIFVETLTVVPRGSIVILSAHGVGPIVYDEADRLGLKLIDATCPLVAKVHAKARSYSDQHISTILIGHKGHQEIIGTAGYIQPDRLFIIETVDDIDQLEIDPGQPVGYLTQTTLSISETAHIIARLKSVFPLLIDISQSDICYATQNRQDAVIEIAKCSDLVIICGSANSSNSNRLKETAAKFTQAIMVDDPTELDLAILSDKRHVGISSGASVPGYVVSELTNRILAAYPGTTIAQHPNVERDIRFALPSI